MLTRVNQDLFRELCDLREELKHVPSKQQRKNLHNITGQRVQHGVDKIPSK